MENYIRHYLILFLCSLVLASCSNSQSQLYRKLSKEDPHNTHYKGHYKTGKEYSIKGQTYKPRNVTHYNQTGIASWYGSKHGFHGKKTANGDQYNKHLLSAAHKTLPLPSLARVTNLQNSKSLIVMINDRGPFAKNRIIDLSEKAAEILAFKNQGVAKVKVEYLHKETQDFLKNISLNRKEGSIAKHPLKNKICSINCHIKLVNLKYRLAVNP